MRQSHRERPTTPSSVAALAEPDTKVDIPSCVTFRNSVEESSTTQILMPKTTPPDRRARRRRRPSLAAAHLILAYGRQSRTLLRSERATCVSPDSARFLAGDFLASKWPLRAWRRITWGRRGRVRTRVGGAASPRRRVALGLAARGERGRARRAAVLVRRATRLAGGGDLEALRRRLARLQLAHHRLRVLRRRQPRGLHRALRCGQRGDAAAGGQVEARGCGGGRPCRRARRGPQRHARELAAQHRTRVVRVGVFRSVLKGNGPKTLREREP